MYNIGTSALKEQDYFKKIPKKGAGFTGLHNQHIRQISKVIPNNCKLLYDILLSYSDKNRVKIWPGNDILCDHTGLSERTIRRQLSILETNGLITRKRGKYGRREIHFGCLDSVINLVNEEPLTQKQLTLPDDGHNNLNLIEDEPMNAEDELRFEKMEQKQECIDGKLGRIIEMLSSDDLPISSGFRSEELNNAVLNELLVYIENVGKDPIKLAQKHEDPFTHNSDRPNDFDQRLRILNLLGLEQQAEDLIKAYPQWTTVTLLNKLNDYCQESAGLTNVPRYASSRIKSGQITGIETKKDQSAKYQSERNDDIDRQAIEMRNKIKLFEDSKVRNQVPKLSKDAKKCMTCGGTMAWKANYLSSYFCIKCTPPLENGHKENTYQAFALCDGPAIQAGVNEGQDDLFKKEESKSVPLIESDGYSKWEIKDEANRS